MQGSEAQLTDKKQISDENVKTQNNEQDSKNQPSFLPPAQYDKSEQWVQEYKEQFGTEPSFF